MGWEPLPGHEEPVGLQNSMGRLQRLIGTARPDSLAVLSGHWEQVIGRRLASHCSLQSLRHGTLVVETSDGAVAEQLRWMIGDLTEAANSVLGSDQITDIEVRTRRR